MSKSGSTLPSDKLPAFTTEEAWSLIEKLEGVEDIVLVGGQAVNFWAQWYRDDDPFWSAHEPFTTKDIDFLGGKEEVIECARRIHGKAVLAGPDDHSPNSGKILTTLNDKDLELDFLYVVEGIDTGDIEDTAIKVQHPESSAKLLVMHPLLCLQSKLMNVGGTLNRRDHSALSQLEIAVIVVNRYISEKVKQSAEKSAFKMAERIYKLAKKDAAKKVYWTYGIDILQAVPVDKFNDENFKKIRFPQMRDHINSKRHSFEKLMKRAEKLK